MQMVSDVPIGAFLSGGIDSSTVVGYMAAHSDQPIRTYSIGFEGTAADDYYNELPYARRVASGSARKHREIIVRPDVVALLPQLLWHMDEPLSDTAFITTYLVSQFARQDVTVILSGVGGDELFGGYRRYLGNHYQGYFDRLPGWMRRAASAVGGRTAERSAFADAQPVPAREGVPRGRGLAVRGALPGICAGVSQATKCAAASL